METVSLFDQLRASRALYDAALADIESLNDAQLAIVLKQAPAAVASGSTLDRLAAVASDSTLARLAAVASDSTLDRLAAVASGSTLARLAAVASDSTLARLAAVASDSTLARLAAVASGSTLARLAAVASDSTLDRLAAVASGSTLDRLAAVHSMQVPVVPDLDKRVAEAVGAQGEHLRMERWHCGTSHCRAGWAVTLAGDAGAKLEEMVGSEAAGRLIYEASTGRIAPNFFASDEAALADIRHCAGMASE